MIIFLLYGLLFIAILSVIWSFLGPRLNSPTDKQEKGNIVITFARYLVFIIFLGIALFILIPNNSRPIDPKKACYANQRVIAGTIEEYYKKHGTSPDPIDLRNGKINLKFLVDDKHLKGPIHSYPECIYVGFPYASGTVEAFCLSCGFCEQVQSTIRDELKNRFLNASPTASIMVVDFSATPDYSQQDTIEFFDRVRTWYSNIPFVKELMGSKSLHREEKF